MGQSLSRVHFREQQTLHAADLRDEQAYRLALRRMHDRLPHRWGIIAGLELKAQGRDAVVQPGLAVDGYGRTLLVLEPLAVPAEVLDGIEANSSALTLRYSRVPEHPTGRGKWPCGFGQHTRWREETRLCLTPIPNGAQFDPVTLLEDLPTSTTSSVDAVALDDAHARWPVYLGRLTRTGSGTTASYEADLSGRPYASLVGETVRAASKQVQMSVGRALGSDGSQFAVTLPDAQGAFTDDRLTIDSPGATRFRGRTTLVSDLTPGERSAESNDTVEQRRSDLILADYCFVEEDLIDPDGIWCRIIDLVRVAAVQQDHKRPADRQQYLLEVEGQGVQPSPEARVRGVLAVLNQLLQETDLYSNLFDAVQDQVALRPDTWQLLADLEETPDVRALAMSRQPADQDRLVAARQSALVVRNRMILEDLFAGQIRVRDDRPSGAWGLELQPLTEPPQVPAPWQIYRTELKQDDTVTPQLRIEVADPGAKGNPRRSRLAVGYFEEQQGGEQPACNFHACLTVDASCTVTVRGELIVEGELIQGPIQADLNDPRLAQEIIQATAAGASAGLAASTLAVTVTIPAPPVAGQAWSYTVLVENTGQQALRTIGVYDAIGYTGLVGLPPTRTVGLVSGLAAGNKTNEIPIAAPALPAASAGGSVEVVLTLIGLTEGFQYMYQTGEASAIIQAAS